MFSGCFQGVFRVSSGCFQGVFPYALSGYALWTLPIVGTFSTLCLFFYRAQGLLQQTHPKDPSVLKMLRCSNP